MGSDSGIYPEPCTRCGIGKVSWFWFSDHYDSGSAVQCDNCKANDFTEHEIDQMRGLDARIKSAEENLEATEDLIKMYTKNMKKDTREWERRIGKEKRDRIDQMRWINSLKMERDMREQGGAEPT